MGRPVTVQQEARAASEQRMRARYGNALSLTDWAQVTADELWPDDELHWEILLRYDFGATSLELAIWWERELIGLAIATVLADVVLLRFVEGHPGAQAPLKGQRMPIVLDTVIEYAQRIGRSEIRLKPNNEELRNYYIVNCGFSEGPAGQLSKHVEVTT